MRSIAIYGKGGIGKSTCSANLSVSWRRMGLRVLQVGCDPKADSCSGLMRGVKIDTVLDLMQLSDRRIQLSDLVHESPSGVFCVEAGGPTPGVGCAGRGIISAFEKLEELNYKDELKPDIVLYDVLGDVVCGGFAMPIRNGYARDVYIVTSGEKMALYAAANIGTAVEQFKRRSYARLGGIILNRRNVAGEEARVQELAEEFGVSVIASIERSGTVQEAEAMNMTVVEAFPSSPIAGAYLTLAERIVKQATDAE